jgi:beta-lactamase class A
MHDLTRRSTLVSGLALAACTPGADGLTVEPPPAGDDPRFAAIERRIGGRLGVVAWNSGTDVRLTHRPHERFAMASTFKWALAAQILHMNDPRPDQAYSEFQAPGLLQRQVRFSESDLLDHAPAARANLARGWMTVEEMCEAIVVVSDNTCANFLLEAAMGPAGFTRFLREQGDDVTRLDRTEPSLNENLPGDERDTTTPDAMVRLLHRLPGILAGRAGEKLLTWMRESQTGRERLRAGLPRDWITGDKTGTGMNGAVNDVAITWPPGFLPIYIAAYFSGSEADIGTINAAHAEIGRIIAEEWG